VREAVDTRADSGHRSATADRMRHHQTPCPVRFDDGRGQRIVRNLVLIRICMAHRWPTRDAQLEQVGPRIDVLADAGGSAQPCAAIADGPQESDRTRRPAEGLRHVTRER
jgi:hypothetical protein